MAVIFNNAQEDWLQKHKEKQKRMLREQLHYEVEKMPLVAFLELTKRLFNKIGAGEISDHRMDAFGAIDMRVGLHFHGLLKENVYVSLFNEPVQQWQNIEEFVSLLEEEKRKGILMTTRYFSGDVKDWARSLDGQLQLIDGFSFAELLIRHQIGFAEKQTSIYVLDEDQI